MCIRDSLIGDGEPVEATEDRGEVQPAVLAQRVTQLRRARAQSPAFRALAIEDAQGVRGPLVAMLVAQFVGVRLEIGRQLRSITRSAVVVPEGVDPQTQRRQSKVRVQRGQERDHLHVGHRIVGAESLDAQLVVLAEPPSLGPLVAEHGRRVPGLERQHRGMLHKGPDYRGRAFGA